MSKIVFIFIFLFLAGCSTSQSYLDDELKKSLQSSETRSLCDTYINNYESEVWKNWEESTKKTVDRMCIDIYFTEYLTPYISNRLKPEGYIIDYTPKKENSANKSFLKELGEWTEILFGLIVLFSETDSYSSSSYTPSYELKDYGYDYRDKISFDKKYDVQKSSKGGVNVYNPSYGSGFQVIEYGNDYYYRDAFGNLNDLHMDYSESDTFSGKRVFKDPYTSKKIILKQNKYYNYSIEFSD